MIVRTTAEITGTDREVHAENGAWVSKRIILAGDGVDLSFHETTIAAGSMYLLDGHERHRVTVDEEMCMLCVFDPPVVGPENHDENGIYPLLRLHPDGVVREA